MAEGARMAGGARRLEQGPCVHVVTQERGGVMMPEWGFCGM